MDKHAAGMVSGDGSWGGVVATIAGGVVCRSGAGSGGDTGGVGASCAGLTGTQCRSQNASSDVVDVGRGAPATRVHKAWVRVTGTEMAVVLRQRGMYRRRLLFALLVLEKAGGLTLTWEQMAELIDAGRKTIEDALKHLTRVGLVETVSGGVHWVRRGQPYLERYRYRVRLDVAMGAAERDAPCVEIEARSMCMDFGRAYYGTIYHMLGWMDMRRLMNGRDLWCYRQAVAELFPAGKRAEGAARRGRCGRCELPG